MTLFSALKSQPLRRKGKEDESICLVVSFNYDNNIVLKNFYHPNWAHCVQEGKFIT